MGATSLVIMTLSIRTLGIISPILTSLSTITLNIKRSKKTFSIRTLSITTPA
jgi:hypothetical protein